MKQKPVIIVEPAELKIDSYDGDSEEEEYEEESEEESQDGKVTQQTQSLMAQLRITSPTPLSKSAQSL